MNRASVRMGVVFASILCRQQPPASSKHPGSRLRNTLRHPSSEPPKTLRSSASRASQPACWAEIEDGFHSRKARGTSNMQEHALSYEDARGSAAVCYAARLNAGGSLGAGYMMDSGLCHPPAPGVVGLSTSHSLLGTHSFIYLFQTTLPQ
jgi:hypothetical protein